MIPWAQPDIDKKELDAVIKVFKSDRFTMGNNVKLFEKRCPYTVILNIH